MKDRVEDGVDIVGGSMDPDFIPPSGSMNPAATVADPFRCICDPDDLFNPPDPRPRVVEGCPAHQVRGVVQQFEVRLASSESRICGDEQEPDGERCIGWLNFAPGDVQAKCTACGGWEGRWAPRHTNIDGGN